jgi:N-acetylglucosamine kinase-like BadF-type ATPase
MAGYYLGVDIGGTKSLAAITDDAGRVLGVGRCGPGVHQGDDYSRTRAALNTITTQALAAAGLTTDQIAGAGFGISGYDWPSQYEGHVQAIATLGLAAPYDLVNDTILVLTAGAPDGWGISLIAGTSCNCLGRDEQGREGRAVGEGLLFGEGAGAAETVTAAQHAVAAAWTLTGPPTRLTQAFVDGVGARDADDLIEGLVTERYDLDATAAPLVFRVAEQGDTVARDIIRWAGRALATMAIGVCRQLELQQRAFTVVLGGSFFNGGALLIDPLRERLHAEAPHAKLVRLDAPPVIGGVLLGMQRAGLERKTVQRARQAMLANAGSFVTPD